MPTEKQNAIILNAAKILKESEWPISWPKLKELLGDKSLRRSLMNSNEIVMITISGGEEYESGLYELVLDDFGDSDLLSDRDNYSIEETKTPYEDEEFDENNPDTYQVGTRVSEYFYWHKDKLGDFWKKELITILENTKKELSVTDCVSMIQKSFLTYYKFESYLSQLYHPDFCDAGIDIRKTHFESFILQSTNSFYLKADSIYDSPDVKMIGLAKWDSIASKAINNLSLYLPGILRAADDHTLSFDDLHHRVNRLPIKLGIPKPFSVDFILRSLKVVPKRFEIDEELKTVTLTRDTRFLHDYFMENKVRIDQFNPEYEGPAIIAFIFEGDYIFEEDEREYFKLRPIIYIGHYENLKKAWKSFIDEVYETRLFIIRRFFKLNANTDIEKLGKENLRVAEYYEKNSELSPVVNEFINRYAPAYVTEDNPGNFIGQKLLQEASMEPLASFDENRKKYLELDPQDESQKEQFIEFIKSDIKKCGDKYYFDNFMHCIELYDTLYDSVEAAVADYWERLETNDGAIPPEELAELFRRFSEAKNNEEPATTEDTNMTDPSDEAHRTEVIYQELIESYKHDKIIELLEDCYEKLSVELPFQFTIENLFSVLQNSPEKVVKLIEGILRINYQTKKSYWKAEFLRTLNFIMVEVTKDRDKSEYGTDIKKE